MSLVPKNNINFKLKNFGADKVFVISERNSFRREEFIKAWKWSDLKYEFVDAIMGKELDLKYFIESGRLTRFIDPSGNISKNIIAVALSHQKAYRKALAEGKPSADDNGKPFRNFLFLEDDARPTNALIDMIQSGEYRKLLRDINKFSFDILWLGRARPYIKGKYLNNRLQHLTRFDSPGAHAYMINRDKLFDLIEEIKDINMPADLRLDKEHDILNESLATYQTLIGQMGIMLDSFTGDEQLPKTHINNLYKSQTQLPRNLWNKDNPKLKRVNPDMYEFIEDVEEFDYHTEIGYLDNSSGLGEGENSNWKRIIFKNN